mmetsp:Transcript_30585/g.42784  ORF Transcript_30585/g.42784 Transcript_30585/m.42784 type:complete len:102 (-) Transcript_30585:136-441(-)
MRSISHYTEAENVVIKLIGSKSDLVKKRVVPKAMADELAERFGVEHIVTSAKLNHNVEECFLNLAQELVEAAEKSSGHSPRASDSLKLQTKQSLKRESSCC